MVTGILKNIIFSSIGRYMFGQISSSSPSFFLYLRLCRCHVISQYLKSIFLFEISRIIYRSNLLAKFSLFTLFYFQNSSHTMDGYSVYLSQQMPCHIIVPKVYISLRNILISIFLILKSHSIYNTQQIMVWGLENTCNFGNLPW